MKCPLETREHPRLLLDFCSGRLDTVTAADLERHVAGCLACTHRCAKYRDLWSAMDDWRAHPISADFDRRFYERLGAEKKVAWWHRLWQPFWPRPAVPVAAAAALVALAGFMLETSNPKRTAEPPEPQAQTLEVEQVERTLEDLDMLRVLSQTARTEAEPQRSM